MIEINNLTTNPVDEGFLKKVAEKVLFAELRSSHARRFAWAKEENKKEADLSIALVGQGRMRELNKKYKKKNRVADVLAFPGNGLVAEVSPLRGLPSSSTFAPFGGSVGEIVICLREVKKNAKRFNSVFEKELAKVLIHGILHLLGEDHEKGEKEAEKMREKEEDYLSQLFA